MNVKINKNVKQRQLEGSPYVSVCVSVYFLVLRTKISYFVDIEPVLLCLCRPESTLGDAESQWCVILGLICTRPSAKSWSNWDDKTRV